MTPFSLGRGVFAAVVCWAAFSLLTSMTQLIKMHSDEAAMGKIFFIFINEKELEENTHWVLLK